MRNNLKVLGLPLLAVLLLGSFPTLGASRDTNLTVSNTANVTAEPAAYYHHDGYRHRRYHHRRWWYFGIGG